MIEAAQRTTFDKFAAVTSNVLLFCLIFGLSATVQLQNLKQQLRNTFALGTGVVMQFAIMPLLGFLSVKLFQPAGMTQAMGVTLLVVTASPGGSFSNLWCSLFNAELALSVAMTSVSSVLSIGLLPANLLLYSYLAFGAGQDASITARLDFVTIFISLGLVMAAIVLGLYCGYRYDNPRFHGVANKMGTIAGLLLILFSIFLSSSGGGGPADQAKQQDQVNFFSHPWAFYVGVALPCIVGVVLANIISVFLKLKYPETVAIAIECCYQNVGIATSVAVTMYSGTQRVEAISVPLLYGIVEALVVGVYCLWAWKFGWTKAPPDENICTVVTTSYEIVEDQEEDQQQQQVEESGYAAPNDDAASSPPPEDTNLQDQSGLTTPLI